MCFCHSISQTESKTCDQTDFGQWWRACSSGPTAWRFLLAPVHVSMYEAMHNLSIHKVRTIVHVYLKINCNIHSILIYTILSFKEFIALMSTCLSRGAFYNNPKMSVDKEKAFDIPSYVLDYIMNGQWWLDGDDLYHSCISMPTLLIWGRHDKFVSLAEEEAMNKVRNKPQNLRLN